MHILQELLLQTAHQTRSVAKSCDNSDEPDHWIKRGT
jgi:hypothetical protein